MSLYQVVSCFIINRFTAAVALMHHDKSSSPRSDSASRRRRLIGELTLCVILKLCAIGVCIQNCITMHLFFILFPFVNSRETQPAFYFLRHKSYCNECTWAFLSECLLFCLKELPLRGSLNNKYGTQEIQRSFDQTFILHSDNKV